MGMVSLCWEIALCCNCELWKHCSPKPIPTILAISPPAQPPHLIGVVPVPKKMPAPKASGYCGGCGASRGCKHRHVMRLGFMELSIAAQPKNSLITQAEAPMLMQAFPKMPPRRVRGLWVLFLWGAGLGGSGPPSVPLPSNSPIPSMPSTPQSTMVATPIPQEREVEAFPKLWAMAEDGVIWPRLKMAKAGGGGVWG